MVRLLPVCWYQSQVNFNFEKARDAQFKMIVSDRPPEENSYTPFCSAIATNDRFDGAREELRGYCLNLLVEVYELLGAL